MKNFSKVLLPILTLALGFALFMSATGIAAEKQDFAGWEIGSEYNKLYKSSELDQFKGVVEDIKEVTPLSGMSPGVALIVRDRDEKELNTVHLGPKGFVNLDSIGLKRGDDVKVKGVWAEIKGNDVFLASKVKKGEYTEIKVRRTKDGTPYWTMSPEELAKERSEE
jgi:hypothetical protein